MRSFKFLSKEKIFKLPKSTGVYCFKNNKEILYIGKAVNIGERVKNHFHPHTITLFGVGVKQPTYRDNLFINQVFKIGYLKTDSEIEALILEASLIKKYQPKFNIVWRDDKNYFFVVKTKDDFPRIFITHQLTKDVEHVGPFVDGKALKETLKVLRKVFPYRSCNKLPKRPCLWYQLIRCPAPCLLKSKLAEQIFNLEQKIKKECQKNTENVMKILKGEKIQVLKDLKKEMKKSALKQDFEKSAKIRDQIINLEKVLAHSKIFESLEIEKGDNWTKIQSILQKILKVKGKISRIEAYDISNIQGKTATGSMVTFINGKPAKNFYRKFKLKMQGKPDDIAMIKEILNRRFKHLEWGLPDLILIDGGKAQFNAAQSTISNQQLVIPAVALAKKKNELYIRGKKPSTRAKLGAGPVPHRNEVSGAGKPILLQSLPRDIFNLILQLRDEAHRFARKYHLKLREIDLGLK